MSARTTAWMTLLTAMAPVAIAATPGGAAAARCVGISDASNDASVVMRSPARTTWVQAGRHDPTVDLTAVTVDPTAFLVRFHVVALRSRQTDHNEATGSWEARFRSVTDRYRVFFSSDAPVVNAGIWKGGGAHVWRNGRELADVSGRLDVASNAVVVDAPGHLRHRVSHVRAGTASTFLYAGTSRANGTTVSDADYAEGVAAPTTC